MRPEEKNKSPIQIDQLHIGQSGFEQIRKTFKKKVVIIVYRESGKTHVIEIMDACPHDVLEISRKLIEMSSNRLEHKDDEDHESDT